MSFLEYFLLPLCSAVKYLENRQRMLYSVSQKLIPYDYIILCHRIVTVGVLARRLSQHQQSILLFFELQAPVFSGSISVVWEYILRRNDIYIT